MLMPTRHKVYTLGCPEELVSFMKETADKTCGVHDAQWIVSEFPTDEMRGYCVILFECEHLQTVAQWTADTAVLWIAERPDIAVLQRGFVDALPLPLSEERFAASFLNMICRCDLKRRLDIRENELKAYYEISDDMLWSKDMADLHMDINHILIDLVGKPRDQIEGKHEIEVYGLEPGAAGCKQSDFLVRTSGKMNYFEESMPGADGKQHHLRVTKAPWLDGQGRIIGTIGLAKDVSELMNQQTKFTRFLDDLELGVVIVDNRGDILQANKVYLDITGLPEEEILGQPIKELEYEKSNEFGVEDYMIPGPGGKKAIWTCSKFELKDYWGKQYGYTYVLRDVTVERNHEKQIKMMAVKDQLTGLPNRAGLCEYFDAIDKRGSATFLFIDVDNFKLVNDRFGHNVGDNLLRSVASLFHTILSVSFTARIGGDEFLSIISGSVGRSEVKRTADALLQSIKQLPDYPEEVLESVSFSIGILYHNPLKDSLNNIICKSDEGMYQAKQTGKNKYCFYMPHEFERLRLEQKRI
jgi:diguanylate cyclase (GGDEF)-like protein/PAS domain S-box-containing protein